MSIDKEIQKLLKSAAESFGNGLEEYWPVINPDQNSLKETNLTFQFGAQCLSHGMKIYPEASDADASQGHKRVDLLVKGKFEEQNFFLIVESKRLYSTEKAREIVADYERINTFTFLEDHRSNSGNPFRAKKHGLLLALTTSQEYADWWKEPTEYDQGGCWDQLMDVLNSATSKGYHLIETTRPQYFLFAFFENC